MEEKRVESQIPTLKSEILNLVRSYLERNRLADLKNKGKKAGEVTIPEDAETWICDRILDFEQFVAAFDKKDLYPLLCAVNHVLTACYTVQKADSHIIPTGIARNLMQELYAIIYGDGSHARDSWGEFGPLPNNYFPRDTRLHDHFGGDPSLDRHHELSFGAEEKLMEEILTIGEKYGLIIDERRPKINEDGSVRLGYKYNKVGLENAVAEAVKARMRAEIEKLGEPFISLARQSDPGIFHSNKDPEGKWDFSHCI